MGVGGRRLHQAARPQRPGKGRLRGSKTHPGCTRQDTRGASRQLRQGLPSGNKLNEKTVTGNVYLTKKKKRKERSVRKSDSKSL